MDRRERLGDGIDAMLAAFDGWQSGLWTAMPAVVQSFNAAANTITAQPAIQFLQRNADGSTAWKSFSPLVDVPVVWQGGGGYTMTFPIAAGDECLIVFASRCIDAWWQSGGVSNIQTELRMHDPSDGFALVGVRSKPRAVSSVSGNSVQLRADDGSTYVEVAAGQLVNVKAPGGINLNGVTIDSAGNVTAPAGSTIKAPTVNGTTDVVFAGKSSKTHTHSGVTTGSGNTGAPT
jgi:hypothetical protein